MTTSWLAHLITALCSALFTGALALLWYRLYLRGELEAELRKMEEEFERRVTAGALAAGEALLPKFREQVSLGFQDALAKSHAAGLVEGAAGAVNIGTNILGAGLASFLGVKPKK